MSQFAYPAVARVRELDWLMLAVVALCCLGLAMAVSVDALDYEASAVDAMRTQGTKLVVGLVAFVVCAAVPLDLVKRWSWPLFVIAVVAVYAAWLVGPKWGGAHRWLKLGSFHFQPVDIARPALVLLTAALIDRAGPRIGQLREGLFCVLMPAIVLATGLALQPDLGNALLCATIAVAMALTAGVRVRWFALAGVLLAPAFAFAVASRDYAMHRLTAFLTEAPYQVDRSLLAIGSGGLFGAGIGDGWMKMGFVPEATNDFIFAVIGEELGLIGTLSTVGLYVLIGFIGYRLVLQLEDPFYRYVVLGCTMAICLQAAVNLLVTTGMAPAKGIDLPLVSSGGTNLMATLGLVGLIGNAARSELTRSS